MDWPLTSLDAATMTNLYLYGQPTTPTPDEKTNPALIRGPEVPLDSTAMTNVYLDAPTFMKDGPGRFAYASDAPLVKAFFNGQPPANGSLQVMTVDQKRVAGVRPYILHSTGCRRVKTTWN